jgi:hypothetical protein
MGGHDEMRQRELKRIGQGRRLPGFRLDDAEFAREAVRPQRMQKFELGSPGPVRAAVGEVDDLALMGAVDCGVRLGDETLETLRQPMVAAGRATRSVHALLDNRPAAVVGDDEAVQIEVKAILDGGAVDLRHQAARGGERGTVDSDPLPDRRELERRLARMFAAPPADMDAELARQWREAALQRADHACGDPRRMPVHPHDRAERLKPERVSEAAQQLVAAVMMDDRLADHRAEAGHAVGQP